jgi:hypothetical protein
MADKPIDLAERRWARDEGLADTEACLDLAVETAVRAGMSLTDFRAMGLRLWLHWTQEIRSEQGETP